MALSHQPQAGMLELSLQYLEYLASIMNDPMAFVLSRIVWIELLFFTSTGITD